MGKWSRVILVGCLALGLYGVLRSGEESHLPRHGIGPRAAVSTVSGPVLPRELSLSTNNDHSRPRGYHRTGPKKTGPFPKAPVRTEDRHSNCAQDPHCVARTIEEALYAEKPEVRAVAVSRLGFFPRETRVVETCLQALLDPEAEVRVEAALALNTLGALAATPDLQRTARSDPSPEVRRAADEAVRRLLALGRASAKS